MKTIRSLICKNCKISFGTYILNKQFCSDKCRKEEHKKRHGFVPMYSGLTTGTTGAINELKAASDLLSKGYEVFRSLSPSCSCDLAILKNGKLLRIEVRTGTKGSSGKIYFPKRASDTNDHYAVVLPDEIIYVPEIA